MRRMKRGNKASSRAVRPLPMRAAVGRLAVTAVLAATTWIPAATQSRLRPAIVFVSTRDNPGGTLANASEIYLMDADGTNARRLTNNQDGDSLPALSPDGSRIVFDSNRLRSTDQPANTQHLFLMNIDGSGQKPLAWGSSASWSPDGKRIAFHASASGVAAPTRVEPGAPASDSDIFIGDVEALLAHRATARNLTNSPSTIDDDADWSPDGRRIVYTSRAPTGRGSNALNDPSAEIFVINADGSGSPVRLTANDEEERAPAWSPDGKRILYVARKAGRDFELCVMNADGTGQRQLTDNTVGDLTSSWSLDGREITFHRVVSPGRFQLFSIGADGKGERQITDTPGLNGFPKWGRIKVQKGS
jgi:TolB protein